MRGNRSFSWQRSWTCCYIQIRLRVPRAVLITHNWRYCNSLGKCLLLIHKTRNWAEIPELKCDWTGEGVKFIVFVLGASPACSVCWSVGWLNCTNTQHSLMSVRTWIAAGHGLAGLGWKSSTTEILRNMNWGEPRQRAGKFSGP